jgi:excisionase family DNA binding protein
MRWMKIAPACEYMGGISAKTLYAAVRKGECKAARIGAGRNLLFADAWLDAFLEQTAGTCTEPIMLPARRRA